jgi:hypothetical protein
MRLAVYKPAPPLPVRDGREENTEHCCAEILRLHGSAQDDTKQGAGVTPALSGLIGSFVASWSLRVG